MRNLVCASLVAALLAAGCGDSIDSTPERQDGSPSGEFEPEDIDRAENADGLVEEYCDGAESEAQKVGCLSHVTVEEVCEQDTDGKVRAVEEYGSGDCD